jgi:DNA-binding CsgD family transcriptional regulator
MRGDVRAPHTRFVARRVSSSVLVGRTEELAGALEAVTFAKDHAARILLIAGDAGIGKTRLIAELCGQAQQRGMLAAVGGCVQLGEGSVAYAPLIEALRDLREQLGADTVGDLLGAGSDEIGALLGESRPDAASAQSNLGNGPLFEHLLGFLVRLGAHQPTVLVFEDMHWADPSTRDLVAFLSRNLRDARLALALSYRTDELHRRHPLRSLVTALERDQLVERITLQGLSRPELVTLLGEISDEPITGAALDDLMTRTDGNPFYVEELVAAAQVGGNLPATLSEAILARVSELPAPTPMVIHQAAVLGLSVDDELLAEITGQAPDQVADALREAVARQLLVIDASGCRFRHALVQEALYDDLLPGERERLHVAAARALQSSGRFVRIDPHVRWTLLAHHAYAAHDVSLAFAASVRAGIESERMFALAAAAGHFERALELWDQVPDPATAAEMTRAELIMRAAESAHFSSGSVRDIALIESALEALDADAKPEQRAVFLERLGRANWVHLRGKQAVAAYEEAVALLANRPPSPEQAFTLSALGQSLMLRDKFADAERVLRRAIRGARAVNALATEGHALCSLGPVLVELGQMAEGLAASRRALELCRAHGTTEDVCRCFVCLAHSLYFSGLYDEAERVAADGMAYAESIGQLRYYGAALTGNRIMALILSGRWREAAAAKAAFDLEMPESDPYLQVRWLNLLLGEGRADEARPLINRLLDLTADADDVQFRASALLRAGELAGLESRWNDARGLLADGLAAAADTDDQYYRSRGYAVALQAEADRAQAGGSRNNQIADIYETADRLIADARRLVRPAAALPETRAWLITAEAHYLRVRAHDDPQTWTRVAEGWAHIGQPYQAAIARYRQADALVRSHGDRGDATHAARNALVVAERLGAVPLAADIRRLAERGRLDLAAAAAEPARSATAGLGVTSREAEVLRELAIGRTNRQIAEALFISEKTASVHVTNLLRKLGVTSRVEAAAIAQRAGMSAPSSSGESAHPS